MPILIRPVLISDLDQILVIEQVCFDTDQLTRRSFIQWIMKKNRIFLVAEQDAHIIAYVLIIYRMDSLIARVYSLAVLPQQRKTGVGRLLMSMGEQAAQQAGKQYMRLEVSVDNIAGITLYETLGYQKFALRPAYYQNGEDALCYQKTIALT